MKLAHQFSKYIKMYSIVFLESRHLHTANQIYWARLNIQGQDSKVYGDRKGFIWSSLAKSSENQFFKVLLMIMPMLIAKPYLRY